MNQTTRHLRDRTVVITGASAGVGRAVALRFAKAGANLALIARDAAALDDVKQEAEKLGGSVLVAPADVAEADLNKRHSAAGCLLRRQARAAWVYRFASHRARSRQQRGRGNRGRTAGGEYAAIRLGAHAHAAKATSGAAGGAAGSGCRNQLRAALYPKREYWLGVSTLKAILDKILLP
jgi:NAD(P)-dependent dehydrogenase (short-subunit alcohol dehydrogenase family)